MLKGEELAEITKLKSKKRLTIFDLENSTFGYIKFPDSITNARQMLWHIENKTFDIPECPICGDMLSWNQDKRKYRTYCSRKCTAIGSKEKSKNTSIKKYGVEHYSKTDEYKTRVKKTSIEKYGTEHYTKTDEYKNRTEKTNIEKFGVPHPAQNPEIIKKMKTTTKERYGEFSYAKTEKFKEDLRYYSLEKYGTEHPLQCEEIRKRIKNTNIEKYGCEYPLQNNDVKEKFIKTRKENYYDPFVLEKLKNKKWLEEEKKSKTIYQIADEIGVSASNLAKYYRDYDIEFEKINSNTSYAEQEIANYLKSIGIKNMKQNIHNIIYPKEIDIFLPEYNLAIEYNGIYWHGETKGKDKNYHINKTQECEKLGIQMLHINDVEWLDKTKKDIWKSIILSNLGLSKKIDSNSCIFSQVSIDEAKEFLEKNDIEGFVDGEMKYGLYYEGELVQCMIISKNDNDCYELKRNATKKYITVINGISELFSKIPAYGEITTYINRRFSNGNSYRETGMTYVGNTPPIYYYFINNSIISEKTNFKDIIAFYDESKTEWENMQDNGYDRIWDCGNLVFTYEF